MNTAVSMILLKANDPLRPEALLKALAARWPGTPAPTPAQPTGDPLLFDLAGAQIVVGPVAAPVPWSELEAPCETSALWPEAAAALRPHAAHWIVLVKGPLAPLALTTLATQLSVAALEAAPSALGVYWGAGGLVLPRDLYIEHATRTLPHAPALPLWVDVRVGPGPGGGAVRAGPHGGPAVPALRQRSHRVLPYDHRSAPPLRPPGAPPAMISPALLRSHARGPG